MRILFIYPDLVCPDPTWSGFLYHGLAYLSACAREAGHETRLRHVHHPLTDEELVRWVEEHRDGDDTLIAFSATTNQFTHVRRWAKLLERTTGLPKIVGGMHATLSPAEVLDADGVDFVCRGDGEGPLLQVIDRLRAGRDMSGIDGVRYRAPDGKHVDQGLAPPTDVNRLPVPHWEIFEDLRELMVLRDGYGVFMVSRGCPYRCAYCCNGTLLDAHRDQGKYLRVMDVPRAIHELEVFVDRYPQCRGVFFEDDVFGYSRRWLDEFASAYRERIAKPFGCNVRPNMVTPDFVATLARAGCERVHMAVESGSDEIRNGVLGRNLSREQIIEAFDLCRRHGIQLQSYNIVGSPHETPEQVLETIKFNAELAPDFIQPSILYPYAGTPVCELVDREGLWAEDRVVEDYFVDTPLEQESIHRDQVLMFQRGFQSFVRHYQRLGAWPRWIGRPAELVTDRFLAWRGAPRLLRLVQRN